MRQILDRQAGGREPRRVVDKMPDNYLHLGLMALLFPRATLIYVRRDVRDVALSCWLTHFRSIRWSDDLDWLALLTKLRATGMPVRDMQRYAELVRSGAGHAERLDLLKRHREEVRRALASQRETLKLLEAKIGSYERRVTEEATGQAS